MKKITFALLILTLSASVHAEGSQVVVVDFEIAQGAIEALNPENEAPVKEETVIETADTKEISQ